MKATRRIAAVLACALGTGVYAAAVPAQAADEVPVAVNAAAAAPTTPPAQVCGNADLLTGPATAPDGAVVVPKGDNTDVDFSVAGETYWFAPGEHTLGTGMYSKIVPGPDSTFIGGPGAVLTGKNINLYAFESDAENVTISYLTIRDFGEGQSNFDQGVVNHGIADGWVVEHSTIVNNDGAGVMLGSDSVLRYNCLKDNGQYGFSMWKRHIEGDWTIKNILMDHNEIVGNNSDDWETVTGGCGCTGAGKFWDVNGARITNNWVHDNLSVGLWADTNNVDFLIEGNYIADNDDEGIFYEISYNATIRNNTLLRNGWVKGQHNTGSPAPAIYLSESGGEDRLASTVTGSTKLRVYGNYFGDNFSGVSIFENANRFCNSNGNTSSGYCTPLISPTVIPSVDPPTSYPAPQNPAHPCYTEIDTEPYKTDCRWHAKNIEVTDNEFHFDPANVPCTGTFCGANALIASGANNIDWAPWTVGEIQDAVMFNAGNVFANNAYHGPWHFAKGYGESISWDTWRAAPFNQDQGSTSDQGPPPEVPNVLDADTATIEGSVGEWGDWYSTTVAQSTAQAHGGTHGMEVTTTAPDGWGVTLNNYPGFAISPGEKLVQVWAKTSSAAAIQPKLTITWRNVNQEVLQTDVVTLPVLTGTWQLASGTFTAPAGTTTVLASFTGSGTTGTTVYFDDISIGDTP